MSVWARFVQDCRDLWALITKGQPDDDPLLAWRMMAELAKQPAIDLDAWEADMFARSGVWWFDPARYDGTEFAWVKRTTHDDKSNRHIAVEQCNGFTRIRTRNDDGTYRYHSGLNQLNAQGMISNQMSLMQQAAINPYHYQNQANLSNAWYDGFDLLGMKH